MPPASPRRWQEAAGDPARMVEAFWSTRSTTPRPGWSLATSCAELAQIREEIASLRGELRSEITAVRSEITALSGELRSEITAARGDMRSGIASVRSEIAAVRGDIWRVVLTVFGAQVVLIGILVTILFQILR
jgi:type II secretory pathway component PulL